MYLIHWPVSQLPPESGAVVAGDPNAEDIPLWETFEAMNLLVEEVRIHLSVFSPRHIYFNDSYFS